MPSQDFLNYSLAIGFLILVGFLSYGAYHLAQALKSLKLVLDDVEDTTNDINELKNKIKFGALSTLGTILSMFAKSKKRR